MNANRCDPRALRVARELHQAEQPEITILFGSRARGDYKEGRSDIDILLIRETVPEWKQELLIEKEAEELSYSLYGWKVPVQTVWYTPEEFDRLRRTANHVVARALQDGVILPRDPEDFSSHYNREEEDYSEEWTVTAERLRHAGEHLIMFDLAVNTRMDNMIGLHAQQALEHAMKALISARGRQYKTTHNLNELVGDMRRADPQFRFRLEISGDIYNQYAGRDEYQRTENPLTHVARYEEKTKTDVQRIIDRVREVHDRGHDDESN